MRYKMLLSVSFEVCVTRLIIDFIIITVHLGYHVSVGSKQRLGTIIGFFIYSSLVASQSTDGNFKENHVVTDLLRSCHKTN